MADKNSKTPKRRTPPRVSASASSSDNGNWPKTTKRPSSKDAVKKAPKPKKTAEKKPKVSKTKVSKPKKTTSARKSAPRKSSGGRGSLFGRLLKFGVLVGLWCGILLAGVLAWYASELPDITKSASFERQSSLTILDSRGRVLTRYGELKGNSLGIDEIPPNLINAVMAIEDRRFYSHFGIDPIGLLRAFFVNARAGDVVQGGSTITQQLAKNLFLSHDRTLKRKIQEALLALWLEYELSKDEIMSAYLNRVYLGSGAYGVEAAAKLYFDKPAKNLTLRESAILAGLLKAPTRFSPRRNPNLANERADVVLAAMADAGFITKDQAKGLSNIPPIPPRRPGTANAIRYYTDWVVDGLDDLIGTPEADLIIETTLVAPIQDAAEKSVFEHLSKESEDKKVGQGAAVVMAHDGAVLALVGGRDYNKSQFNRITQAMRQPGSSFKPVVYLTALRNGWTPESTIMDERITTGRYRPENFGGKYYGLVDLQTALTLSLNTVAMQLTKEMGPQAVIDTARALGFISPMQPDLSIALGSYAVTPLELTTAYTVIANGGFAVFPYAITKIRDENGKVYYERPAQTVTRRVVDARSIAELQMMMQSVVEYGTGQRARQGFPVGGKTGTSQDSRDAWFAGFSDKLVATAWVGNDDNTPTKGITGGSLPAAIWGDIIAQSQGKYTPRVNMAQAAQDIEESGGLQGLLGRLIGGSNSGGGAETIQWNAPRINVPEPVPPPSDVAP